MSAIGEAIQRSIRPNVLGGTRASTTKAVVLGGYTLTGPDAVSYNMNIGFSGADANSLQMLYVRVPEVHRMFIDPYCEAKSLTAGQFQTSLEMHAQVAVPKWVSDNPSILPGSIVDVEFLGGWSSGIATKVIAEATSLFSIDGIEALAQSVFTAGAAGVFLDSAIGAAGDPGTCAWSNGAQARETMWQSTVPAYSKWNSTKMRNGLLEETGMLVSDPVSGAKLVPPAMEDFKRLAAAFKQKFDGKILKGSGYRSYASQVNVRMERASSANPCGSGEVNAAGVSIGKAATPGTSNHGWGAAVDLNRSDWEHGATKNKKKAGSSKHFQWINKFSKDFNFVFGVSGEHWHLDWMPFTEQVTGWSGMKQTVQTSWTSEGIGDPSITLA
jgi:hypothetical protein